MGQLITTIENYEKRIRHDGKTSAGQGRKRRSPCFEGDAQEVLKTLDEPSDFFFMDAAKGQYIHFLPDVLRLLVAGGLLVSDNVMQDGRIIESRFGVDCRDRDDPCKDTENIYLYLKHHEALITSIVPLGDGVALSVERRKGKKNIRKYAGKRKQI